MAEQNFSNSDRADPITAAKIGRLLGVDAIIIGSITQFGRDDKTTSVGGGAFGGITRRYGLGGVGKREAKAVVGVTARLVNTDTGEILVPPPDGANRSRSGTTLLGARRRASGRRRRRLRHEQQEFRRHHLGRGRGAGGRLGLSSQLEQNASRLPTRTMQSTAWWRTSPAGR